MERTTQSQKISLAAASPQTKVNLASSPASAGRLSTNVLHGRAPDKTEKTCTLFAHQHHLVDDILFFFFFLSYLHAYMFSAGEIKDNEIQTRALF